VLSPSIDATLKPIRLFLLPPCFRSRRFSVDIQIPAAAGEGRDAQQKEQTEHANASEQATTSATAALTSMPTSSRWNTRDIVVSNKA